MDEWVVVTRHLYGPDYMVGKVIDTRTELGRVFFHATVMRPGSQFHTKTGAPCGIDIKVLEHLRDEGIGLVFYEPWGFGKPVLIAEVDLIRDKGRHQWWVGRHRGLEKRQFLAAGDWRWEREREWFDHWVKPVRYINVF